ncbi:MAG: aldo/keto reductase [Lachnospiraceae bacterium]|nr:aldo/keto reductase [Lachnospiraceae bacterium]
MSLKKICDNKMKRMLCLLWMALMVFSVTACGTWKTAKEPLSDEAVIENDHKETKDTTEPELQTDTEEAEDATMNTLILMVDDQEVEVEWENNESVSAITEMAKKAPVRINMSMYGGFEQVGSIGQSIPRNDKQTTTKAGDIVLYSGNQVVVFYGSNSWAYTRLGRITDKTDQELTKMLGNGDVTLSLFYGDIGSDKANAYQIEDIMLNSGYQMPVIGLGTWTLSNDEAEKSVYHALKSGMRLIDTARYYRCEVGVGKGIQRAIDEGIVSREEIFVTSKIMPSDFDRAAQGIDDSLRDLNLSYLDLMLIHQPGANDKAVYQAMEKAVRDGKVRSIGISNYYTKEAVDEVLSYAEIVPAVIQNENHLYYQNNELQEYVKKYGIVVESWYPFGGRGHTQENFNNDVIVQLADKYGKTSAQIILRWQVQAGYIAIPGSSNPEHIAENYDIFDFELSEDEMQSIYELDRQERYENW